MSSDTEEITIGRAALDALLNAHDGDVALLYLWYLREGDPNAEKAARGLCRTMGEIRAADEKLVRLGLLPSFRERAVGAEAPSATDELPEYLTADILARVRENREFTAIVAEAQKALGHTLSSTDMKKLFGFYDYYALPGEVILMLLNHCVSTSVGRRPTIRYIEKEARRWAELEIHTIEQAEDYIRERKRRGELSTRMCEAIGLRDREPSPSVKKLIEDWITMGFGAEAVKLAADRAMLNGKFSVSYINGILSNWHERGIHTLSEIEERDGKRSQKVSSAGEKSADRPVSLDELRKILDKM